MGADELLAAIRDEAERQAADITAEAEAEAEHLREEARREAERIRENARQRTLRDAQRRRRAILHEAEVKARHIQQEALHDVFERARDRATERLAALRATARYEAVLRRLTSEALNALQPSLLAEDVPNLTIDARDTDLFDRMADLPDDVTLTDSLEKWGGVVAASSDGQVRVDNRLESRLEKALPALRQQFMAHMTRVETD